MSITIPLGMSRPWRDIAFEASGGAGLAGRVVSGMAVLHPRIGCYAKLAVAASLSEALMEGDAVQLQAQRARRARCRSGAAFAARR